MTNKELFFNTFPCLKQDEEWPNLLWWTDEKGKPQLLGDIYDSNFWDAEYKEPIIKGSYHPIISGNTQNPPKVKSAESENKE